jgi:hypothetical protein
MGKFMVEILPDDQIKYCIAEKLEPLIVVGLFAAFVCQRSFEKGSVLKTVVESLLKVIWGLFKILQYMNFTHFWLELFALL